MEWLGIVLEGVRGCWSGVGAARKVLECVGMVLEWCWSGLESLQIVLEGVRGCWSGVEAAWNMLECVGMVSEWIGVCLLLHLIHIVK